MTTHTRTKVPPIPHGCGSVLPPPVGRIPGIQHHHYDPSTRSMEYGVRFPESIYGAVYDPDTMPYFHRLFRHIYHDIDEGCRLRKVSENAFRLVLSRTVTFTAPHEADMSIK